MPPWATENIEAGRVLATGSYFPTPVLKYFQETFCSTAFAINFVFHCSLSVCFRDLRWG